WLLFGSPLPRRLRPRQDRREVDAADPARPHAASVAPVPGPDRVAPGLRAQHAVGAPVVAGGTGPDRAPPVRAAPAAHGIRAHRQGPRGPAGAEGAEGLGPEAAGRGCLIQAMPAAASTSASRCTSPQLRAA